MPSAKASRPWPDPHRVLADVPLASPLVCSNETVDSQWGGQSKNDLRIVKSQQFFLLSGPPAELQPQTVVESRLMTLVQRFSSSGADQSDQSKSSYHCLFNAPLSAKTSVTVSGDLIIHNRQSFEFSQQSRLTEAEGTRTVTTLRETSQGQCLEQH